MAAETALKLGYTEEEIENRKHIAMNMDLEEAIKLGLVVNPKIVSCEYMLKEENGGIDNLTKKLEEINDPEEKQKIQDKIDKLRRNLNQAEGIEQILQEHIKPGGKYIVFIPVMDNGVALEDEEGNSKGKSSIEKVREYEEKLRKYLEGSGITPQFHSMLSTYGNKKNQSELDAFKSDKSDETKFMIVMNKANEGLHIEGLDGMIWERPLDENSKILFLQQFGRVVFSENPNNPTPEDKIPVVIDLVNNIGRVNLDKDMKQNSNRNDLELLSIVVDWVNEHDILPNIDSTSKKEQKYAATLYRIQEKYAKYLAGFDEFQDLDNEKKKQIELILAKGTEIDLWDIEFPPKSKEFIEKTLNVDMFEIKGLLKKYVEIENEIEANSKSKLDETNPNYQKEIERLGIEVRKTDERNITVAMYIIEHYNFKEKGIELTDELKKTLVEKLIEPKLLNKNSTVYISTLYEKLIKKGLGEQEVYGAIINYAIGNGNGSYSYALDGAIKYNKETMQNVKVDLTKLELYNSLQMIIPEYKFEIEKLGLDSQQIGENNINMAMNIVEKYNFKEHGINLTDESKKMLVESIIINKRVKSGKDSILNLYKKLINVGLNEQKAYGAIINYAIGNGNGSYSYALGGNIDYSKIKTTDEIKTDITQTDFYNKLGLIIPRYYQELKILSDLENDKEWISKITGNIKAQNINEAMKILELYDFKSQNIELTPEIKKVLFEKLTGISALGEKGSLYISTLYDKLVNLYKNANFENKETIEQKVCGAILSCAMNGPYYAALAGNIKYNSDNIQDIKCKLTLDDIEPKSTYEKVIEFCEVNGRFPKQTKRITQEEKDESNLYDAWIKRTEEKKIADEYAGQDLDNVPEEYRSAVEELRKYGYGLKENKTAYENLIEFYKTNGRLPMSIKKITTKQNRDEYNTYVNWSRSKEKKMADKYAGQDLDNVPEEYREIIQTLRNCGYIGAKQKSTKEMASAVKDVPIQEAKEAEEFLDSIMQIKENEKDEDEHNDD